MPPSRKPINWQEVELAMMAGCNQERIAGSQNVHVDTLRDNFFLEYGVDYSTFSNQMHRKGETLIEVEQFKKALNNSTKGNTQMLIWLGKQRLGQKDREDDKGISPNDATLNELLSEVKQQNATQPQTKTELQ